jgi:hypothetical protein
VVPVAAPIETVTRNLWGPISVSARVAEDPKLQVAAIRDARPWVDEPQGRERPRARLRGFSKGRLAQYHLDAYQELARRKGL